MLHKAKHLFSVILACLFLYPVIYQSIHVFEHAHDMDCCSHCHGLQIEKSVQETAHATYESASEKEDECPVCTFHYAKLQVKSSSGFFFTDDAHPHIFALSYPKPFILFKGFTFALRAPPPKLFLSC